MAQRDAGLQQAISAMGGISALARALGVAQPSVSSWSKVPAERVLAVEHTTGVSRTVLRPDLYGATLDKADALTHAAPTYEAAAQMQAHAAPDPLDTERASLYLALAHLTLRVPDEKLLITLRALAGNDTPLGVALEGVRAAADVTQVDAIAREYFDLFIGVGRGELLPYASYYLTGFLHERPLVRVRQDLKKRGFIRQEGLSEPEDHIGVLCEAMAALALGQGNMGQGNIGSGNMGGGIPASQNLDPKHPEGQSLQHEQAFFVRHLSPWAEKFFLDLEAAPSARFYRAVGRLGQVFIELEREAFALEEAQAA